MRVRRFDWDGRDARGLAAEVRGDAAVSELEGRFGAGPVDPRMLPVPEAEVRGAPERLDPAKRQALETAAANIRTVAEAQLADERRVGLPQGQAVELREVPVGSAAIYAPGGAGS